jgi:hypothetical protein
MKSFLNMAAMKGSDARGRWRAQRAGRVLRKSAAGVSDMTELIELAFQFDYCGVQIAPMQIDSKISGLLQI